MGKLTICYLLVGFLIWIVVSRYLKKRRLEENSRANLPVHPFAYDLISPLFAVGILLWPVVIPIWIWCVISAAKERLEADRTKRERDEEIRQYPDLALSFDEKLALLKKASEKK